MKILRRSQLSGIVHEREIDVTQAQITAWERGAYIQDAMPNLSADDREFILSGITPEDEELGMMPEDREANNIANLGPGNDDYGSLS